MNPLILIISFVTYGIRNLPFTGKYGLTGFTTIQKYNATTIPTKLSFLLKSIPNSTLPTPLAPNTIQANPAIHAFSVYCGPFFNAILSNPLISSNLLTLMFVISAIPSIILPVPKTEFMLTLLANGAGDFDIFVAATVGNVIGEIMLYSLAFFGVKYFLKKEEEEEGKIFDYLKKFGPLVYFAIPFAFFGGDAIILFAGFFRIKWYRWIGPLIAGFMLKNYLFLYFIENGIYIFPSFRQVCFS